MAKIKKITLKNGEVRYRFTADIGKDPETGKRLQKVYTFEKSGEAKEKLGEIVSARAKGTFVAPSKVTLAQYIDVWLPPVVRDLSPSTKRNYEDALRPVKDLLGEIPLQRLEKSDVDRLVAHMLTAGRRRGGKVGTGLSGRTVNLTVDRLRAVLQTAVDEGKLVRNVAALVKHVKHEPTKRGTWTKGEVRTFLSTAVEHRLAAAWWLSLYGLRRGEVLGLRWEDVDLDAQTITISRTRILVDYKIVVKPPKSENGARTLPIDDELVVAFKALKAQQAKERLAAGPAYAASGTSYTWKGKEVLDADTHWVVVDEIGEPVHPEWFSDEFERVRTSAGVPRIVLHGARHTTLSQMEKAGVAPSIISKWAGHYDVKFTMSQYVHANDEDLHEGREALGKLYKLG